MSVDTSAVDTAYDCCVAALLDPNHASVFAFEPSSAGGADNCFIGVTGDTCPNPATNPSTAITSGDGDLVIGNGYCGEVNNAVAIVVPSASASASP